MAPTASQHDNSRFSRAPILSSRAATDVLGLVKRERASNGATVLRFDDNLYSPNRTVNAPDRIKNAYLDKIVPTLTVGEIVQTLVNAWGQQDTFNDLLEPFAYFSQTSTDRYRSHDRQGTALFIARKDMQIVVGFLKPSYDLTYSLDSSWSSRPAKRKFVWRPKGSVLEAMGFKLGARDGHWTPVFHLQRPLLEGQRDTFAQFNRIETGFYNVQERLEPFLTRVLGKKAHMLVSESISLDDPRTFNLHKFFIGCGRHPFEIQEILGKVELNGVIAERKYLERVRNAAVPLSLGPPTKRQNLPSGLLAPTKKDRRHKVRGTDNTKANLPQNPTKKRSKPASLSTSSNHATSRNKKQKTSHSHAAVKSQLPEKPPQKPDKPPPKSTHTSYAPKPHSVRPTSSKAEVTRRKTSNSIDAMPTKNVYDHAEKSKRAEEQSESDSSVGYIPRHEVKELLKEMKIPLAELLAQKRSAEEAEVDDLQKSRHKRARLEQKKSKDANSKDKNNRPRLTAKAGKGTKYPTAQWIVQKPLPTERAAASASASGRSAALTLPIEDDDSSTSMDTSDAESD